MKSESRLLEHIAKTLFKVLLPLALMPLLAQDQSLSREKRFAAYTASGHAVEVWLQSRADLDLVSTAASALDTADAPLPMPAPTAWPNAVFLSAQAVESLNDGDRAQLQILADEGVPIVCECGEYALSRQIGFEPVEQNESGPFEFFVFRKKPAAALRSSVFLGGIPVSSGTPPLFDTTIPMVREQLRAFLLREALLRALENSPPAAGEGSWSNISELRKVWSWTTPEVACATSPPCWDYSKQANAFTVTADFFKIPDGKPGIDYYLVKVRSHHQANYRVAYVNNTGTCSDGWVGWYAAERRLRIDRTDNTSALYEYSPTGTLRSETISLSVGASLDTGSGAGVSASYTTSYTNTDATVTDKSSQRDNYAFWTETFVGPSLRSTRADGDPSDNAKGSFFSERVAIFSTSNPAAGVNLKISPYALFQKTRRDVSALCMTVRWIHHQTGIDTSRDVNVRWNYAPDKPAKPNLTIPPGSTSLWTNTPITVNVPATSDRDGDPVTYSVDFGDGAIGAYGAATQTHSWSSAGSINVKAKAQDRYGKASDWSDFATYTIKGLDRIQIEGVLSEIPEMNSAPLLCRATLSDGSTRLVSSDGWEGGVLEWSLTSPYATISSTGMFQALSAQGVDRTVTVNAKYRLKGVEKTTALTLIVRHTGAIAAPAISSVVNGASFQPGISASGWTTIYGTNLAGTSRLWRGDEIIRGKLPTALDGVSVTMDGRAAAISYVSPTQLNVQTPDGIAAGPITVRVTTANGSAEATGQMREFSPGLFTFADKYVAAQHTDYSFVANPGLLSGVAASPARPGEVVIMYATGFGPTVPQLPSGEVITTAAPLASPVSVWIGNQVADVQWKGMSGAGLWQLNVAIPEGVPDGDGAVVAEVGGVRTQAGVFITVVRRIGDQGPPDE